MDSEREQAGWTIDVARREPVPGRVAADAVVDGSQACEQRLADMGAAASVPVRCHLTFTVNASVDPADARRFLMWESLDCDLADGRVMSAIQ